MTTIMYDFANLLFSGPCNARCYFCIGRQLDPALSSHNLDVYPPRNLDAFVALIRAHQIRQVVFTGTNTDPQLYRHEACLLDQLRAQLPAETRFSLHTNGRLALRKIATFNGYDRAAISLPSFDPLTYRKMMGVPEPPDLPEIIRQSTIPIKISCLLTPENTAEVPRFLVRCREMGIRRLVLRKPFGERRSWDKLILIDRMALTPRSEYRTNPVYDFLGMEVTLWDFQQSTNKSINLFASGLISSSYQLIMANEGFRRLSPSQVESLNVSKNTCCASESIKN